MRKAVSEIFVVPPANRANQIDGEEIKAHLERFFPHYTFIIHEFAPFQDDDEFVLIPIAGIVGETPDSGMFRQVPDTEWSEMYDAVRSFGKMRVLN